MSLTAPVAPQFLHSSQLSTLRSADPLASLNSSISESNNSNQIFQPSRVVWSPLNENSRSPLPVISDSANRNKLKHNLSEVHRRARLADKFEILRQVSHCVKKDRFSILQSAIVRLKEFENFHKREGKREAENSRPIEEENFGDQKIAQEQSNNSAIIQNSSPISDEIHPIEDSSEEDFETAGGSGEIGFPSLSLSNNFLLSAVPTALITENGSFIDVNKSFCEFFLFPSRKSALTSSLISICFDSPSSLAGLVNSMLSGSTDRTILKQKCRDHRGGIKEIFLNLWTLKRVGKVPIVTAIFMNRGDNEETMGRRESTTAFVNSNNGSFLTASGSPNSFDSQYRISPLAAFPHPNGGIFAPMKSSGLQFIQSFQQQQQAQAAFVQTQSNLNNSHQSHNLAQLQNSQQISFSHPSQFAISNGGKMPANAAPIIFTHLPQFIYPNQAHMQQQNIQQNSAQILTSHGQAQTQSNSNTNQNQNQNQSLSPTQTVNQ